jgi:hypothetical protein
MKLIKQHKVILAIILASYMGSGCAILSSLLPMLMGGSLADGESVMMMAGPDAAAEKMGYRWATSSSVNSKVDGANLYRYYPAD